MFENTSEKIEFGGRLVQSRSLNVGKTLSSKRVGTIVQGDNIFLHGSIQGNIYLLSKTYLVDTEYSTLNFKMHSLQHLVGICLSKTEDFTELDPDKECFQFSTPEMIEHSWQKTNLPTAKRYNLALGKKCETSVASDLENSCKSAIDGSLSTKYFTSSRDEEKFLEVKLGEEKLIRHVVIHKDGLNDLTLFITNDEGIALYQSPNIIGSRKEVIITVPFIYGSRIRIYSYGSGPMSLTNIEVFEDIVRTEPREISLPLGSFLQGKELKYLRFIQYDQDSTVTQISDITFENGRLL